MFAGIISIVICSVLLGTIPILQNIMFDAGYSVLTLNLFTSSLGALMLFVLCIIRKQSLAVKVRQLLHLILCAVLGFGSTSLLLNYAYRLMPVGTVTMIHFLYPIIICAFTCMIGQEKFTSLKAVSIALAIIGLAFLCLGQKVGLNGKGMILALCSTITYGFYITSNDTENLRDLDVMVKPFYVYLFSSLFYSVMCAASEGIVIPGGANLKLLILFAIAFFFSCAAICIAFSVKTLGASRTSFLNMIEPITCLILSAVVFKDVFTLKMMLGCVLILGAGCLIIVDRANSEK